MGKLLDIVVAGTAGDTGDGEILPAYGAGNHLVEGAVSAAGIEPHGEAGLPCLVSHFRQMTGMLGNDKFKGLL